MSNNRAISKEIIKAVLPLILVFTASIAFVAIKYNASIGEIRDAQIANLLEYLTTYIEVPLSIDDMDMVKQELERASKQVGVIKMELRLGDGKVITSENPRYSDRNKAQWKAHTRGVYQSFSEQNTPGSGQKLGTITIFEDSSEHYAEVGKILSIVAIAFMLGIAMFVYFIRQFNMNIKAPVENIKQAFEKIMRGNTEFDFTPSSNNELLVLENMVPVLVEAIKSKLQAKKNMERLEIEAAVAIEASRVRTQFLAHMSHEIRNPLNTICGYASMVCESDDDQPFGDENKNRLRAIEKTTSHLRRLVNDVLDFAMLESSDEEVRGVLKIGDAPLWEVMEGIIEMYHHDAAQKGIYLDLIIEDSVKSHYKSAINSIHKVVGNLVSNAVKFTDKGGVVVRATEIAHDHLIIEVADTGIGISEEEIQRIFNPFVQIDNGTTKVYEGSGLGLSIAKLEAERIGGGLGCTSAHGFTTFTLSLPVGKANEPIEPGKMSLTDRVVIKADRETQWMSIASTFKRAGYVHVHRVDDFTVPQALTAQLRVHATAKGIVAVNKPGHQKTNELSWPVTAHDVTQHVTYRMLQNPHDRRKKAVREVLDLKVLVVDDELTSLDIIGWNLKKIGVANHVTAASAFQALDLVMSQNFDLIISDLHMPRMDGFTMIERLRESNPQIKIVVMTADNQKKNQDRLKDDLGVEAVLGKPFDYEDLRRVIMSFVPTAHQPDIHHDEMVNIRSRYDNAMAASKSELYGMVQIRDISGMKDRLHALLGNAGMMGDTTTVNEVERIHAALENENWNGIEVVCKNWGTLC